MKSIVNLPFSLYFLGLNNISVAVAILKSFKHWEGREDADSYFLTYSEFSTSGSGSACGMRQSAEIEF